MNKELKTRIYDKSKETYRDRVDHVNKILSDDQLSEYVDDKVLENLATYILKSNDIESGKKISDSFYLNEHYYKKFKDFKSVDRMQDMDIYDDKICNSCNISDEYIDNLFKYGDINSREKRNLIKRYNDMDISNYFLEEQINFVVDDIFENAKDGVDILVLNFMLNGKTQTEISKKLNISKFSVNRRVKRITS